jgi:hypothetical protein
MSAISVKMTNALKGCPRLLRPFLTRGLLHHCRRAWRFDVSRHKSVDTLRSYVRRADSFKEHAGAVFL